MNFPSFKKAYLTGYRLAGFFGLVFIAAMLVVYSLSFAFFMVNNTWIAPAVLEPTSEKVLPVQSEMIRVRQFLDELTIGLQTKKAELINLENQKKHLLALQTRLGSAMKTEQGVKKAEAAEATALVQTKRADIIEMDKLGAQVAVLSKQAEQEYKAGLITQAEYSQRLIGITTLLGQQTDNRLAVATASATAAERQRMANTLGGRGEHVSSLDAEAKRIEIESRLADIDVLIAQKNNEIAAAGPQMKTVQAAFDSLNETPYGDISSEGRLHIAFLPYDNHDVMKAGAPVYGCMVTFVLCSKVGEVVKEYKNEQVIEFPLLNLRFSRTVRGTFVKLKLDDPSAAEKQVLFVGGKPLFL
jgi:hypothetical protein